MFSPLIRFILLVICAVASAVGAYIDAWPILLISFSFSFVLIWGYFKVGTIPLALTRLRKEDYKETEKLLDQIQKPKLLSRYNKAYYYFINGLLTHENDHFDESKSFLKQAIDIDKLREPDKAMALLALSDMALVQHNRQEARQYFKQIKGMKVHSGMMEEVRKMQEWLQI